MPQVIELGSLDNAGKTKNVAWLFVMLEAGVNKLCRLEAGPTQTGLWTYKRLPWKAGEPLASGPVWADTPSVDQTLVHWRLKDSGSSVLDLSGDRAGASSQERMPGRTDGYNATMHDRTCWLKLDQTSKNDELFFVEFAAQFGTARPGTSIEWLRYDFQFVLRPPTAPISTAFVPIAREK
ncbi:hypothetical protein JCM10212_002214 [Sporobolomyces blumeae]